MIMAMTNDAIAPQDAPDEQAEPSDGCPRLGCGGAWSTGADRLVGSVAVIVGVLS